MANKVVDGQQCFFSFPTFTWYPGDVTTFILPIVEIEQIVASLTVLRDQTVALSQFPTTAPNPQPNDYTKINATIATWNSILNTYRKQTGDLTTAFTNEMAIYNNVVNSFYKFASDQNIVRNIGLGLQTVVFALHEIARIYSLYTSLAAFPNIQGLAGMLNSKVVIAINFIAVQTTLHNYCNDLYIRNNYIFASYENNICIDFDNRKWKYFNNFLKNACDMKIGFDRSSNASTDIPIFYGQLCRTEDQVNPNQYPGGVQASGVSQSMFQFLQSNKAYLTFGAQTDTKLTWSSNVMSSLEHITKFTMIEEEATKALGEWELSVVADLKSKLGFEVKTAYAISIGQTSKTEVANKVTTLISLGDKNEGSFALIISILLLYHLSIFLFYY